MPLRAHLAEARRRLLLSVAGIAVGAIAGWFVFGPAFEILQRPILDAAEHGTVAIFVNFAGVATALDMRLKVAVFLGFIASSPWWLYQVWAFVAPGLTRKERRYTLGFLSAAVPLFACGVALGLGILGPAVRILSGFVPDGSTNLIDADSYLMFAMRLILAFGVAFVFPVVMVGLTWVGLVPVRTWRRGWRWAVLIIFVFAAIATPTADAVTMLVLAVPMCALYFAAMGIAAIGARSQRRGAA